MMCAIKLMEDKRSRDYQQIAMLSVFTIISAAVDMPDETFFYLGVIMSLLVGFQFILSAWFAQDPDASLTPGELSQVMGRTMSIWVMMLPLCIVLFFAAPRTGGVLGQLRTQDSTSYVGFSDRIELGSVSEIQEINALAFRAVMPLVAPRYLFWRGIVLDTFNGREWFAEARNVPRRISPEGGEIMRQVIYLESSRNSRSIFAMDVPIMINISGVTQVADGAFVYMNRWDRPRIYEAFSVLSNTLRPPSGGIRRNDYLRLPDNFSPAIRRLTEDVLRGVDDRDKPEVLMRYLISPLFSYSLKGLPVSSAPLEEFLLRTRSGNCEYFATAMAVMLRMSGIPSRIVAGYRGGVYNENGGYYMVGQSNAHVWVESWDDAEGVWRRYDPTPASMEAGGESWADVRYGFWSMYIDYINYSVSRFFLEYEGDSRSQLMEAAREFFTSPGGSVGALIGSFHSDRRRIYLLALATAGICLVAVFRRYRRYRKGRVSRSRDERLRNSFLEAMKRRGFVKRPNEGLEEFTEGVARALGLGDPVARAAADFVISFEAFYFKDTPITPVEFERLEGIVRDIRLHSCT
jgi:transglutaminase-like putative cysteine protease